MATVAIHNTPGPYWTTVAGPISHSPPPMDAASMMAPGPITRNVFRTENGNGSGSSATSHLGSVPEGYDSSAECPGIALADESPDIARSLIGSPTWPRNADAIVPSVNSSQRFFGHVE